MTRRLIGGLIVLAWVGSLGWLAARRRMTGDGGVLATRPSQLAPGAAFFGVMLSGTPIGNAGVTIDTTPTGLRLVEVMSFDLADDRGRRQQHVYRSETTFSRTLRLRALEARVSESPETQTVALVGTPDSGYALRRLRGSEMDRILAIDPLPGLTIGAAIPLQLAMRDQLHPGASSTGWTIDPLTRVLSATDVVVGRDSTMVVSDSAVRDPAADGAWRAVAAAPIRAWRVARRAGSATVIDWVDSKGRLVRREHPFGVTLDRSPFEVNYNSYVTRLQGGTILPPAGVPGSRLRIHEPGRPDASVPEVVVVVERTDGVPWPGAAEAFAGGRQRVAGDTVRISGRREQTTAEPSPPTHLRNIGRVPARDSAILRDALRAAISAEPGEPDSVVRLVRWVARAVQYLDTPEAPTGSVTVALRRQGGLEGKVELFVALARLAGWPARAVMGLDLSRPTLPAHAWAEVWRDGWEAVDPVFGAAPASAYLMRVAEGAAPRAVALVPLIGSLRASVVIPGPAPKRR